jgi:hypothetical protein
MKTTKEQREELRRLEGKATRKPWHHHTATIGDARYAAIGPPHPKDYGKEMSKADAGEVRK